MSSRTPGQRYLNDDGRLLVIFALVLVVFALERWAQ